MKCRDINRVCCEYFLIPRRDFESRRRENNLAYPRQVAMYLAKTLTSRSFNEIGRCMGDRDHSTVLYGARKIAHLITRDASIAYDVAHLELKLEKLR